MCISFMSGNRESSGVTERESRCQSGWDTSRYAPEKSDRPIVPEKLPNKAPSIVVI